jgi:addiction module HigA family antidote
MAMHDPLTLANSSPILHPYILGTKPISGRELAAKLGVAASTLNRVLKRTSNLSPEMALRLSKALRRSPESWLANATTMICVHAKQRVDLGGVSKIELTAA